MMNTVVGDVVAGKMQLKMPYSVIFADLNGLKWVNDTKGHKAGDEVLKTAAAILKTTFPEEETA